jgi:hypothetical protein
MPIYIEIFLPFIKITITFWSRSQPFIEVRSQSSHRTRRPQGKRIWSYVLSPSREIQPKNQRRIFTTVPPTHRRSRATSPLLSFIRPAREEFFVFRRKVKLPLRCHSSMPTEAEQRLRISLRGDSLERTEFIDPRDLFEENGHLRKRK